MSLYHFSVTQKSRGAGQSVVASAAYISGTKLHDNYYVENPDYTKKSGVLHSEIILPDYVPKRFYDREILWNEVENVEKHPKAQLAYSFDIALQNELSFEENLSLARQFILDNFTSRGMIVDMALHEPDVEEGGISNPHFHVLCPIRPVNPDGTWGAKQHREYILDEAGNRIKDEKGRFIFNAIPTTDWGSPDTLLLWRENWARLVNDAFARKGLSIEIDHRSYASQGLTLLPTIHEGPAVRAMEKKGIRTEKGDFNRMVKAANKLIQKLHSDLKHFISNINKLSTMIKEIREEYTALESERSLLLSLIKNYYSQRIDGAFTIKAKTDNLNKYNSTLDFLSEYSISTFDDLANVVKELYASSGGLGEKISTLEAEKKDKEKLLRRFEQLKENEPYYLEYKSLKAKSKRKADDYYNSHYSEISIYHMAHREITEVYPSGKLPKNKLLDRIDEILDEIAELYAEYYPLKDKANMAYSIKKSIETEYKRIKDSKSVDEPSKHRKEVTI